MEKPGTTDLENGYICVGLPPVLGGIPTDVAYGTVTSYGLWCTSLNFYLFSVS